MHQVLSITRILGASAYCKAASAYFKADATRRRSPAEALSPRLPLVAG